MNFPFEQQQMDLVHATNTKNIVLHHIDQLFEVIHKI